MDTPWFQQGGSEEDTSFFLGQVECCFGYLAFILGFVRSVWIDYVSDVTVSHVLLSSCRASHAAPQRCSSSSMRATALLWVLQTPKKIKCLKYQMLVNIIYNKIFPYLVSFLENKMLVAFYLQGSCVNKLLFLKYFMCHQEWQNKIQACLRCIQSCILGGVKSQYILCSLGHKIMEKLLQWKEYLVAKLEVVSSYADSCDSLFLTLQCLS